MIASDGCKPARKTAGAAISIAYLKNSPINTIMKTRVDMARERNDPKAVAEAKMASDMRVKGNKVRCQNS